jgi:hypothetical protein
MLVEPALGLGFADDGENFDGRFVRDVIKHPEISDPQAILRLTQADEALDAALAPTGRLMAQVPFDRVANLRPMERGQIAQGRGGIWRQNHFIAHFGYYMASFGLLPVRFAAGLPAG